MRLLTEEQKASYGRFAAEPSEEQVARFFHLDDEDKELVLRYREDHESSRVRSSGTR